MDQRIMVGRKHETWEESLGHLTLPDGSKPDVTALSPLKIGYRSTHEIMTVVDNKPIVHITDLLIISFTVIGKDEKDGPRSHLNNLFQKLTY